MADNIIQATFAAGEVSPDLYARVDLAKYHTGAALLRNFFVNYKGGASSRPGTQFLGTVPDVGTDYTSLVRLRRFVFSATQQYILVFSDHHLHFIRNLGGTAYPNSSNAGFILNSDGSIYSLDTPYAYVDLFALKFAQSADIMQITHNTYPRMILSRLGDTNWTLMEPVTGASIDAPAEIAPITISSPPTGSTDPLTTTYLYGVTAVSAKGEESTVGGTLAHITGLDMTSTLGSVTLNWPAVSGASYYKVYKAVAGSGGSVPSFGQQLGYIGFTYGTNFTDSNIVPDFTQGPPAHTDPFSVGQITNYNINSGGSGYSATGAIIGSPVGGAELYPIVSNNTLGGTGSITGIYVSNPGDNIPNGTVISSPGDGSGFSATLTTSPPYSYPACSAYFQQRLMLASTPQNPVTVWGSKSGYYNNFDVSNPVVDNDALTFTLAVQEVNAILWMVAMPGGLVLFTDSSVQQLSGGSIAAINPAAVTPTNAAMVPISNFGSNVTCEPFKVVFQLLYVQSEGGIVREITYNPFFGALYPGADLTILSSHLFYPYSIVQWAYQDVPFKCVWAVRNDGVLLSLTYLKEQDVAGWTHHDTRGGLYESVEVIREGVEDAVYFVVNRGGVRFIERLASRDYRGGVTWAWCLDAATSYSGAPVSTISGLDYLEGQSVMALADGQPLGSFVVSGGSIELIEVVGGPTQQSWDYGVVWDDGVTVWDGATQVVEASNVVVGLGIQCQLQTLYLDLGGEGRVQGKRKKIAAMSARVRDTAGALKMGSTFNTLTTWRPGFSSTDPVIALPAAPPGMTVGDMRMVIDPAYQVVGCVCIQQDDPLPVTVLGVIPEIALGDF